MDASNTIEHTLVLEPRAELEADPILTELALEHAEFHGLSSRERVEPTRSDELAISIERPRALALHALAGTAAGSECAIVVFHALSPSIRGVLAQLPIWALGYQAQITEPAVTVRAVAPNARSMGGAVAGDLEIDLAGAVATRANHGTHQPLPNASPRIPGVVLRGLTTTSPPRLSMSLVLDALEAQAGAAQASLAFWQIYRARRAHPDLVPLVQTVVAPLGTTHLRMVVHTWARVRRALGGGQHHWVGPTTELTVRVEQG
ncbi:MAG: hypothetical protein U0271_13445 [Polyangiaceae bacterium]